MTTKPKLGPPFLYGEKLVKRLIGFDAASLKQAKKLGKGNVSAGVRKALAKGAA